MINLAIDKHWLRSRTNMNVAWSCASRRNAGRTGGRHSRASARPRRSCRPYWLLFWRTLHLQYCFFLPSFFIETNKVSGNIFAAKFFIKYFRNSLKKFTVDLKMIKVKLSANTKSDNSFNIVKMVNLLTKFVRYRYFFNLGPNFRHKLTS